MSDDLKDCVNCELRKGIERTFDLHWHDQYDCPFTCPEDKKEEEAE